MSTDPNTPGNNTTGSEPRRFVPVRPRADEHAGMDVACRPSRPRHDRVSGAANAYLGLRAGMTIAATYPAAIVGMAVLRLFRKPSVLEENIARTVGSIGESIATGSVFTIPPSSSRAAGATSVAGVHARSTRLMIVGGLLGILFVALLRRVMVEDKDLKFPSRWRRAKSTRPVSKGSARPGGSPGPWPSAPVCIWRARRASSRLP